jgi:hypothetical protein
VVPGGGAAFTALSAFWATVLMIFIVLTQRPLKGIFRKLGEEFAFKRGFRT